MSNGPDITRVRHELKRRRLTVARVERLAPEMVRVVLQGAELEGFTSLGFDDHVKLFFPSPEEGTPAAMRDFTPRRHDSVADELWIDFFLHEAGPAASWAMRVAVGDSLDVGGPKGSMILSPAGIDSHVFIGDETALPAISRRLEELPGSTRALVLFEVDSASDWPPLQSPASLEVIRVVRKANPVSPAYELIEQLRTVDFPQGQSFIWVALESQSARTIRRYLREERGIGKDWIKAAAYWQRGAVGVHQRIEEEG